MNDTLNRLSNLVAEERSAGDIHGAAVSRRDFLKAAGALFVVGGSSLAVAAPLSPTPAPLPKAKLLLVGGPSRDHLQESGIYRELIKRSRHGTGSTISFVTSASKFFRQNRFAEHLDSFRKAGGDPKNVHIISIMKPDDPAETIRDTPFAVLSSDTKALEAVLGYLRNDDIVFFDGGDQKRLVPILKDARIDEKGLSAWDHLVRRYREEDGFLLGGTSAGSAAMPRRMIHAETVSLPEPAQYWGFNLPGLEGVSIDTHYDRRNRSWRFPAFMKKVGDRIGIGLPENGGIYLAGGIAEPFSVGAPDRLVAAQLLRPGGDVEKKFRAGERFALADLHAETTRA